MQNVRLSLLALAGVLLTFQAQAQFADAVVDYQPGSGYSAGYTNSEAVLGEPSRITPGAYGGPVTPFSPAYLPSQVVSIGQGGCLTLRFDKPVHNHPRNQFGVDFILFGNTGFVITNEFDLDTFNWVGTPATDGSVLGANPGETRVSVSQDGVNFYLLDPASVPTVDASLPTDGAGDFTVPPDPSLGAGDFAGATEDQIRLLYNGSGGGGGYDLASARDAQGNAIRLAFIRFVRIEVLSGRAEVDGVSAVFNPPGNPR